MKHDEAFEAPIESLCEPRRMSDGSRGWLLCDPGAGTYVLLTEQGGVYSARPAGRLRVAHEGSGGSVMVCEPLEEA